MKLLEVKNTLELALSIAEENQPFLEKLPKFYPITGKPLPILIPAIDEIKEALKEVNNIIDSNINEELYKLLIPTIEDFSQELLKNENKIKEIRINFTTELMIEKTISDIEKTKEVNMKLIQENFKNIDPLKITEIFNKPISIKELEKSYNQLQKAVLESNKALKNKQ